MMDICPVYADNRIDVSTAEITSSVNIYEIDNVTLEQPMSSPDSDEVVTETTATVDMMNSDIPTDETEYNTVMTDTSLTTKSETTEDSMTKPLVSFEEWQKRASAAETEKDRRHKLKSGSEAGVGSPGGRRQMVDSIDGGFSDDFGSMFEDLIGGVKKEQPNVYEEQEYISPSVSKNGYSDTSDKMKQQFAEVRSKSLKERFNYASIDCAATVRKANKEAKGAQSILYESKDQYLLNKCSADKYVIINLCEQIVVDTIVMANFEFFSSTFKDFRVYASSKYPTHEWKLLGQWQARNTRDLQIFKVPDSGFVEYLKIEFLTHYGNEYYCPLSLVRVHGMSMMEYYTVVESQDDNPVLENEHLWSAEVREQIIQPQHDVNNASESFPTKVDVDDEEDSEVKIVISPFQHSMPEDISSITETYSERNHSIRHKNKEIDIPDEDESLTIVETTDMNRIIDIEHTIEHLDHTSTSTLDSDASVHSNDHLSLQPPKPLKEHTADVVMEEASTIRNIDITLPMPTHGITDDIKHIPLLPSSKPSIPIMHPKEGSTQESIYKTIMKRLALLEVNVTLSQRYMEDQNKMLNDVFLDMERRHQDQLISLIGHLNETASHKIDSMKRRYEQYYDDLKGQTDNELKAMTTKLSILADQLSFERRLSMTQLIVMIGFFVWMALSRGTLSILSPVMAAQLEERKRRSVQNTPSIIKEVNNTSLVDEHTTHDMNHSSETIIDEIPSTAKPYTRRRHSDNICHLMNTRSIVNEIHTHDILSKEPQERHRPLSNNINIPTTPYQHQEDVTEQEVPLLNDGSIEDALVHKSLE